MKKSILAVLIAGMLLLSVAFVLAGPVIEDTDGDGVLDTDDLCADTPIGTVVDATGCPIVVDSDTDGDGVLDTDDLCADSVGVVNSQGCSVEQVCLLNYTFKNHGGYVSCVAKIGNDFVRQGLMTEEQRAVMVSTAAQSEIGK